MTHLTEDGLRSVVHERIPGDKSINSIEFGCFDKEYACPLSVLRYLPSFCPDAAQVR